MIIKVCGLKFRENLLNISALDINMVGYNFYKPSPRFVQEPLPEIPFEIKKVGVFVNASEPYVLQKVNDYKLDFVQLHGDESPEFCKKISESIPVIKVFRIDEFFNDIRIQEYEFCDFFLFDTATKAFGGSGKKFDWTILNKLDIKVPFFLSGGLGPDDLDDILNFCHPKFLGIDINSKFEISVGLKDVGKVKVFVDDIRKKIPHLNDKLYFENLISPLGVGGKSGIEIELTNLTNEKPHFENLIFPLGDGGKTGVEEFVNSNYDMFYGATPYIFATASSLRRNMTKEELIVWNYLKTKPLGFKFRRQHPINIYVADFYCHALKLAIEIDGINHIYNREKDMAIESFFESLGITIIRFTNTNINEVFDKIINKIENILNSSNKNINDK